MRVKKIVNEKGNEREKEAQELQEFKKVEYKLQQGLNGVYYKEFRRATLLNAYDTINDFIDQNKDCAGEWYQLRRATRDVIITFSGRKELNQAIKILEQVLGVN